MKQFLLLLLLGLVAGSLDAATPRLINIDFGNAAVQGPPVGKAAVGLTDSDVWNLSSNPFLAEGGIANLLWSDGVPSGANLYVTNAPGAWGVPVSDAMFSIYAYNSGGPISVHLSGLPSGTYDFVAYGHGEVDSMNTRFEVDPGTGVLPSLTTGDSPRWRTLPFEEGAHYVVFRSVRVSEGTPVVLTANATSGSTPFLNGLQILKQSDLPPIADAQLLNIDFGNAVVQGPPVGKAAVGLTDSDVWNLSSNPFQHIGSVTNLVWSDGSLSDASLLITNAPGAWTVPVADPMFAIYAYSYGGPIVATVSKLREGTYDIYAYGHGERDDLTTRFSVAVGGITYPDLTTGNSPQWRSLPFVEGAHYVIFRNVTVPQGEDLQVTATATTGSSPFLNGLQFFRRAQARPVISPAGGFFTNSVDVVLSGVGPEWEIHYTLDGTVPTITSPVYAGSIKIRSAVTVTAVAFRPGVAGTAPVSAEFQRVYAIDDGVTDEWRLRYFGPDFRTDPKVGADADPDQDGASNLAEFVAGSNPLDPLSGFSTSVRMLPAVDWVSIPGKTYRILRKASLTDATWTVVQEITASAATSRFIDVWAGGAAFYYVIEPVR